MTCLSCMLGDNDHSVGLIGGARVGSLKSRTGAKKKRQLLLGLRKAKAVIAAKTPQIATVESALSRDALAGCYQHRAVLRGEVASHSISPRSAASSTRP